MYCEKCNKQIADDSIFCNYCGVKIESNNQPANTKTREELIITSCKDCVEKHLKAPATVNYSTIEIKDQDSYGRIYLYVEVDSQNSYGAYIRSKLHVVLQYVYDDGRYEALDSAVMQVSFINTEKTIKSLNKWNRDWV